ncbi:MAG: YkgJ family cysteine cluster protein [Isosphaeraceae bacterium]
MSAPLRKLPVMQNWDCHGCGDCCHRLEAVITDVEKRRIEALDLANDPEVAHQPWFARGGRGSRKWKLKHRPDGGCVFLTAQNRCRIQERFGAEAKPFVCRLFPFMLIPAGDHWRVGMRFSCPSAAANRGRPVVDAEKDLVQLSRLLEKHTGRSADSAPPPSPRAGQPLAWPDVGRVVEVLVEIVQDRGDRLERRLRKCLALARACGQLRTDEVRGDRLSKFLQAVRNSLETEVPREPADVPPPDRLLGRTLFRVLLPIFARRYRNAGEGSGIRSSLDRVLVGWRFFRGRGPVPRVNEFLPATTFEEIERCGRMPLEMDETLERYYVNKLNSLQFCGPPNFDLPLWAGLESLVLTLPMILWLTRAFADRSSVEAVQHAIQIVDDHFGGDPMLGLPHIQSLQRLLAQRGELEKLVAWYGRS